MTSDLSIYQGHWKNGYRHGRGRIIKSDGTAVTGIWVKDLQHGVASIELKNGKKETVYSIQGRVAKRLSRNFERYAYSTPFTLLPSLTLFAI